MGCLISVVVPVYNVRPYVYDAIDSILRQTYKNIEVIIVDDCSSDGTYEYIKNVFGFLSRVRIFRNEKNLGIVYSLNRGVGLSSGDLIARMDGDDIAEPNRLEQQYHYLINNNVDLVGCSFVSIDERGRYINSFCFPSDFERLKKVAFFASPVSHIWLAKKNVYKCLGGYRFPGVEDYDFLLRMITHGFCFSNVPNYYGMKVRVRNGNTNSKYGLLRLIRHNFVRKLYIERLRFGKEVTSSEGFYNVNVSHFFYCLHAFSMSLSNIASRSRFKAAKYFFYIASAVVSPYQAQSLYYSLRRKILFK